MIIKNTVFIVPLSQHASFSLLCRSLPPEIGELTEMRDLTLANNLLRALPYELGKCFQLTVSNYATTNCIQFSFRFRIETCRFGHRRNLRQKKTNRNKAQAQKMPHLKWSFAKTQKSSNFLILFELSQNSRKISIKPFTLPLIEGKKQKAVIKLLSYFEIFWSVVRAQRSLLLCYWLRLPYEDHLLSLFE